LLDRHTAEEVVKRVRGVHAVANELAVDLLDDFRRDDVQIANAVEHALRWNVMLPADRFRVAVSKGWVTIEGEVPFAFQRRALQDTVEHLFGVRGLTNLVSVKPAAAPEDVRRRINTALHRYAQLEADGIQVDVSGRKVVLHGKVRSWAERDRVQTAAWSAPGVSEVDNHLEVGV
jgi:osmotically-inducible protein OsmY